MWTLHKQMESVKLKLKFFFSCDEPIVSCDENFFIYMTETKCGPSTNKRKRPSWNKIFFIYMTETKCGPLTNKRKVESWNKIFFLM